MGRGCFQNFMLAALSNHCQCSESQNGLEEANFDGTNDLYLQSIQASGNLLSSVIQFMVV